MKVRKARIFPLIGISAVILMCILPFFAASIKASGEIREPLSLEEVSKIEEAGTYAVSILVADDEKGIKVEQVIYITITQESTTISEQYSEAIDANPLIISSQKFKDITTEEIIDRTNARAWSTKDGSKIPITIIEKSNVNSGQQQIRLSTEKGTTLFISVAIPSELKTEYESQSASKIFNFSIFSRHRIVIFCTVTLLLIPPIIISGLFGRIVKQMLKVSILLYKTGSGEKSV